VSGADIAAQLVAALEAAAEREAGKTALVSVTIDVLKQGAGGGIETHVVRKTRTLVFLSAELTNGGQRLVTASSVHKVLG
jgi:acyl-coenzyme A thioesterase PaaI-like protein